MKIKPIKQNYFKQVSIEPEQQNMIARNMFLSECDKFFRKIDKNSLKSNIFLFGRLTNLYEEKGLNEYQAQMILRGIKTLLDKNKQSKTINLINVMYSTMIKRITPDNILKGELKAETYRRIIDESINMYKSYPLSKGIDYRHILGRLVSFKDMSAAIEKNRKSTMQKLSPAIWTENEQLELVNILGLLSSHYKIISSDFIANQPKQKMVKKEQEEIKNNYLNSIVKLLWMLRNNAIKLMKDASTNIDEIKSRIEMAEYYLNKIPFTESVYMQKVWKVISDFRQINTKLKTITRK